MLAAVASSGTALLRSWPTGFRSWVADKLEDLRASPADLTALRSRLKRFADKATEPADLVDAVVSALPDLHRHAAHAFAIDRRYYLYKDVQRVLGLSSPAMDALKSWPGIEFLKLNEAGKEQGQFNVEQIDKLLPVFRESVFISGCASGFGLPIYAIEQLCAAEVLEWEDHAALLATTAAAKVRRESVGRLVEEISGKGRRDEMPRDCVSLAIATRRIGGRLKPWASIIDALRKGRLSFWMPEGKLFIPTLRVRAKDLTGFQAIVDAEAPDGMPVFTTVSQEDAAEILNLAPKRVTALSRQLAFPFERQGHGLAASRAAVLAAAAEIAFNAEVALHENVHHRQVDNIMVARSIAPLLSGWRRRDLVQDGIIPPPPIIVPKKQSSR